MGTNQSSNMHCPSPAANPLKNTHIGLQISQTTSELRYPFVGFATRLPVLTQQITSDFQLSQKALDHLRNQMNELAETNRLLKKAVKNTYQTLTNVKKSGCKENPN